MSTRTLYDVFKKLASLLAALVATQMNGVASATLLITNYEVHTSKAACFGDLLWKFCFRVGVQHPLWTEVRWLNLSLLLLKGYRCKSRLWHNQGYHCFNRDNRPLPKVPLKFEVFISFLFALFKAYSLIGKATFSENNTCPASTWLHLSKEPIFNHVQLLQLLRSSFF